MRVCEDSSTEGWSAYGPIFDVSHIAHAKKGLIYVDLLLKRWQRRCGSRGGSRAVRDARRARAVLPQRLMLTECRPSLSTRKGLFRDAARTPPCSRRGGVRSSLAPETFGRVTEKFGGWRWFVALTGTKQASVCPANAGVMRASRPVSPIPCPTSPLTGTFKSEKFSLLLAASACGFSGLAHAKDACKSHRAFSPPVQVATNTNMHMGNSVLCTPGRARITRRQVSPPRLSALGRQFIELVGQIPEGLDRSARLRPLGLESMPQSVIVRRQRLRDHSRADTSAVWPSFITDASGRTSGAPSGRRSIS